LNNYFQVLYDGVAGANQYDQILFYEFGRNYWLYANQLDYHAPDNDPVATGFAVYMRFVTMNVVGVAGGPYNGVAFSTFASAVTNLIDSYALSPGLNWSNTFRISQAPPNSLGLGGTDLIASLLMRIGRDFGGTNFAANFWHQAALRPSASSTLQAADNFVITACAAVHTNLTQLFAANWKWPVSSAAIQQAQKAWGTPVTFPPPVVVSNRSNNAVTLSWSTEPGLKYQVQRSSDLLAWTDFGGALVGTGGTLRSTIANNSAAQLFFRIMVQ